MRKLFLFFLAVSCGPQFKNTTLSLGQERSYSPVTADAGLKTQMTNVCKALQRKTEALTQLVSTPFTYSVATKSCTEQALGTSVLKTVSIQRPVSTYVLRETATNVDFVFPDVENTASGVFGEICTAVMNDKLTNPMKLANGNVIWMGTTSNEQYCVATKEDACIQIETGLKSFSSSNYLVSMKDWYKIKTTLNLPRTGFTLEHRQVSNALCDQTKSDQLSQTYVILQ